MSTKIFNQKGFTAFEGVLIAIILALIAGVGYYVYQARTDKENENKTEVVEKKDPYQGWNTFESNLENVTFQYPNTWKVDKLQRKSSYDENYDQETVVLSKNGYEFEFGNRISGLGGACYDPEKYPEEAKNDPRSVCPLFEYTKIGKTKVNGIDVYKSTRKSNGETDTVMVLASKETVDSVNGKRTFNYPNIVGKPLCEETCMVSVSFPKQYSSNPLSTKEGKEALLILESFNKK